MADKTQNLSDTDIQWFMNQNRSSEAESWLKTPINIKKLEYYEQKLADGRSLSSDERDDYDALDR